FLDGAIADDPGIVYKGIEPAMSILYLFHHGLDLHWLRHVTLDHQRLVQLLGHIHCVRLILPLRVGNVIDHPLRAVRPKTLYHFRADPARATGDQDNFASEIEWIRHLTI